MVTPSSNVDLSPAEQAQVESELNKAQDAGVMPATASLAEILAQLPLHTERSIIAKGVSLNNPIRKPQELELHCSNQRCGGARTHRFESERRFDLGRTTYYYFGYVCANCGKQAYVFGLRQERSPVEFVGIFSKIYQEPGYGEPIPKRLFGAIDESNREHFLNARRAIARGLGIGAFAYYRRIVENQKLNLIGAVLKVAEATNAPAAQIEKLKVAAAERQFSKAIEMVKEENAIPASLLIDGHNPLSLLHDHLSGGIHEMTDEECLGRARHAEAILCELAVRIEAAVSERQAVKAAIAAVRKK
ncbi:MAG TPA: hypothetical protein VHE81_19645 [Lacipirellulaceae bacterium]|nr:hypothetical protein [Lacipirellulaceae bacterium]